MKPQTVTRTIRQQLRNNAVALISLVVAISSLGYNTWRNEVTEHNRNQRAGSFEILLKLGDLQQLVFHLHYDKTTERGNPRTGWAIVLTIRDLAQVLEDPLPETSRAVVSAWDANWEGLGSDPQSLDDILEALEAMREDTQALLRDLE